MGILDFFTGRTENGVNRFQQQQTRRAPIVHSQGEDSRIVLYDDNSMSGVAARANANAIYGRNNTSSSFARRVVIEVQDAEGNWTPVNQINPGAPVEEQIAALHAFRETGQIGGTAEGSNLIGSQDLPGGTQAADFSHTLTLATRAQAETPQASATATSSDFAPVQTVSPASVRPRPRSSASNYNGVEFNPERPTFGPGLNTEQAFPAMTGTMQQYAQAISSIESGSAEGNYSALGRIMETGSYRGDRAYGRYQVMGRNIPEWTQQALGVRLTPEQFLSDSAAQDAVFAHQFQKAIDRYGSPQDAASVWFTGRPASNVSAQRSSDGNINGAEYVRRFNVALGAAPAEEAALVEAVATRTAPGAPNSLQPNPETPLPADPGTPDLVGPFQPGSTQQPVEVLTGATPTKVDTDTSSDLSLIDRRLPDLFDPRNERGTQAFVPTQFF